jgi:serine/alanine adding enzyme
MVMTSLSVRVDTWTDLAEPGAQRACREVVGRVGPEACRCDPRWLTALCRGLHHKPYLLVARQDDRCVGMLPLALIKSRLFGRFLVSLPYVNSAGVVAEEEDVARALVDRAVELADELDVRYLELRHERPIDHPALGTTLSAKVHMRLPLPGSADELWKSFKPKVRNQVRKAEKLGLNVHWNGPELLSEFYAVFARNMRDLGTPVFGRRLFASILAEFSEEAELGVVRLGRRPVAAGLLVHGNGVTSVPSASSLREYNATNANMLIYWHMLQRAIERGQKVFDFGRSSLDSSTYRFKKQWGAQPEPAVWQYYVRKGTVGEMRIESGKYDRLIRLWRRLPVGVTRLIGPAIVRGIP